MVDGPRRVLDVVCSVARWVEAAGRQAGGGGCHLALGGGQWRAGGRRHALRFNRWHSRSMSSLNHGGKSCTMSLAFPDSGTMAEGSTLGGSRRRAGVGRHAGRRSATRWQRTARWEAVDALEGLVAMRRHLFATLPRLGAQALAARRWPRLRPRRHLPAASNARGLPVPVCAPLPFHAAPRPPLAAPALNCNRLEQHRLSRPGSSMECL
jgi:hypothetical protein